MSKSRASHGFVREDRVFPQRGREQVNLLLLQEALRGLEDVAEGRTESEFQFRSRWRKRLAR